MCTQTWVIIPSLTASKGTPAQNKGFERGWEILGIVSNAVVLEYHQALHLFKVRSSIAGICLPLWPIFYFEAEQRIQFCCSLAWKVPITSCAGTRQLHLTLVEPRALPTVKNPRLYLVNIQRKTSLTEHMLRPCCTALTHRACTSVRKHKSMRAFVLVP